MKKFYGMLTIVALATTVISCDKEEDDFDKLHSDVAKTESSVNEVNNNGTLSEIEINELTSSANQLKENFNSYLNQSKNISSQEKDISFELANNILNAKDNAEADKLVMDYFIKIASFDSKLKQISTQEVTDKTDLSELEKKLNKEFVVNIKNPYTLVLNTNSKHNVRFFELLNMPGLEFGLTGTGRLINSKLLSSIYRINRDTDMQLTGDREFDGYNCIDVETNTIITVKI